MGEEGVGAKTMCPRDRRMRSSIVDAVAPKYHKKASHFVSWCWKYHLVAVVSALLRFLLQAGLRAEDVFVWICFFCNNQYRIIGEKQQLDAKLLRNMFENHLLSVGNMLVLLDEFADPFYIKRIWCVFEAYTCTTKNVPMTLILPESAETALSTTNPKDVKEKFNQLDIRNARATFKEDECLIKAMIEQSVGYEAVNAQVKGSLLKWFTESFSAYMAH